jgi:hypothetical protein
MENWHLQARGDLGLQMNYAFGLSSFPSNAKTQVPDFIHSPIIIGRDIFWPSSDGGNQFDPFLWPSLFLSDM